MPKNKFAIKTMKKSEIIASKHVDHIENEKKILERIVHPFAVSTKKFDPLTFMAHQNDHKLVVVCMTSLSVAFL